ncbi:DgyrCDS413 [Dimorphilus gyrociliatus]|uniref:DgyrCDS413 n=1 Tax=Dimorphilus gyrociliatus TaxID=2664684 RepID=A0A7I8V4D6_9ANNE|nr:DgyrCDS413 [Dimorphilus gyrociliatus]
MALTQDIVKPRNIVVTPEISNFSFNCSVKHKAIKTNESKKIFWLNEIGPEYTEHYRNVGDETFYTKKADEYEDDTYFECVESFKEESYRAAFATLSDFKCDAKEAVKEGESVGLKLSIHFTHFSPTIICDVGLKLDSATTDPFYENLNSPNVKLRGLVTNELTNIAHRSMQGRELRCRFDYKPDENILPIESNHFKLIPTAGRNLYIDEKQPKLTFSKFICKKNLNVEYLDDSVKVEIDEDRAICKYDSNPNIVNITFIIRYTNGSQIVKKLQSRELKFEAYLESPITISCTVSVMFYDGTTKEKSSSFSEKIRLENTDKSSSGLSASSQIGIAVGVTMAILVILVVITVIICRRKEKEKNKEMAKDIGSEKVARDLKPQKAITNDSDRVVCADEDGSAVIVDTKANSRKPLYPLDNVNLSSGNDGIASSIYSEIRPQFYGFEEAASGASVIYSNVDKTTPPPPYKIPYSLA